jgi:hypothetical protein
MRICADLGASGQTGAPVSQRAGSLVILKRQEAYTGKLTNRHTGSLSSEK